MEQCPLNFSNVPMHILKTELDHPQNISDATQDQRGRFEVPVPLTGYIRRAATLCAPTLSSPCEYQKMVVLEVRRVSARLDKA